MRYVYKKSGALDVFAEYIVIEVMKMPIKPIRSGHITEEYDIGGTRVVFCDDVCREQKHDEIERSIGCCRRILIYAEIRRKKEAEDGK